MFPTYPGKKVHSQQPRHVLVPIVEESNHLPVVFEPEYTPVLQAECFILNDRNLRVAEKQRRGNC